MIGTADNNIDGIFEDAEPQEAARGPSALCRRDLPGVLGLCGVAHLQGSLPGIG